MGANCWHFQASEAVRTGSGRGYALAHRHCCVALGCLSTLHREATIRLINLCTVSDDTDPLTRTGLPIPDHQQLLLDQNVHKLIIDMVKCPFEHCRKVRPPPRTDTLSQELYEPYLNTYVFTYTYVYIYVYICVCVKTDIHTHIHICVCGR